MKTFVTLLFLTWTLPLFAAFPVVTVPPEEQAAMVDSGSPKEAANKRLVFDLYRTISAGQLDLLEVYMVENILNHNPNEQSGLDGVKEYLRSRLPREPVPIKATIDSLVTIIADGDLVIIAVGREADDPKAKNEKYTYTWFNMFRVQDNKVVEHWDAARIPEL